MTKSPKRVTLTDVGRRAGVSRSAASFVLSGREDMRISKDVWERVQAAAAELGYRPNQSARGLRTNTTQTIGLISDTIATKQFAGEAIHGAVDAAFDRGYLLLVAETEGEPAVETRLAEAMFDRQVEGIVYGSMYTRQVEIPRSLAGAKVVLLNCVARSSPFPAVIPDEINAGRAAAGALLDAGHRRGIYVIGGSQRTAAQPNGIFAGRERMSGIIEVLTKAGTAPTQVVDSDWSPETGYDTVSRLLRRGRRPRALLCLNDRLSLGAYQALSEAGLQVPDDVSVVSFDDQDLASWLRPQLTSVALPHYQLGRTAVEVLLSRDRSNTVHRVPMPLRSRASVGPPRRARGPAS